MELTLEQMNWIGQNTKLFEYSTQPTKMDRDYIYSIYNHITGENKKPNGCGRCWTQTKKAVYKQFIKQTNVF